MKIGDNVFAGKDGQVDRKGDNGWQELEKGSGWEDVRNKEDKKNRESAKSLDRERKARESGDKRRRTTSPTTGGRR